MDGAKIQGKLFYGYGKAAKVIGTSFNVYRTPFLTNPLADENLIDTIKASFTTSFEYAAYNKPSQPLWTLMADATNLNVGDWLSDGSTTYFLADKQALLPLPAVQCSTSVSIARYSEGVAAGGGFQTGEMLIAENLPVFMFAKKDKSTQPQWFPAKTDSTIALPEWIVYVNTRGEGDIQAHDVVIDSQGTRYEVDVPNLTSFGYQLTVKLEKP